MRLAIIESPYAGDVELNQQYARLACQDSLYRNEAPLASHLLYTQLLDDTVPAERRLGIEAGLAWGAKADVTAVYGDLGISAGMELGIERAHDLGRPIEHRKLHISYASDGWWNVLPKSPFHEIAGRRIEQLRLDPLGRLTIR